MPRIRPCPRILGLFQKRIDGDDALLQLAALRFREARMGAEYYASSTAELEWLLGFRPFHDAPVVVHLDRNINIFDGSSRQLIIDFAAGFKGRVYGLVVHDQSDLPLRLNEYLSALRELNFRLSKIGGAPLLFIEYAAGLDPEVFVNIFKELADLQSVSACIDVGHIGLRQTRAEYSKKHPGEDVCALKPDTAGLPDLLQDIESAVGSAVEKVLLVVRELGEIGKPLHFHLHDGHPLSAFSPYGVSDHLSFFSEIPLPFEYRGKRSLSPMFGLSGLSRIVNEALLKPGPEKVSFSLEIHPTEGRLPLGNASYLFGHWVDKGNAERMNSWLSVIAKNQRLLLKACPEAREVPHTKKMVIYNLFPLLAGKFTEWQGHLARASEMGFNWIFVNPIQRPGSSGSLYSIADYFDFNPLLTDNAATKPPREQAQDVVGSAGKLGLSMMMDLVINHCSVDSPLLKSHPEWFIWKANGRVAHPFADENGKKVVWKDLAKFDHRNTKDKEGLYQYFFSIIKFLAELGFRGFRCDAAYQLPRGLWERLIQETKKAYPDVLFLAETLGNPPDLTRKTASAGFDYIFNSSKWWDYYSQWLMKQYALTRDIAPSISFPESHDTVRLAEELGGSVEGLKQRYLFSALFSGGVMMPMGYEFGFKKRLHVVNTRPGDWESTGVDLTYFIAQVNRIKAEHVIFQEDTPTEILHHENPNVLLMWKASIRTQEESLLILNKDIYRRQHFYAGSLQKYLQAGAPLLDISPENPLDYIPSPFVYDLAPGQGIVLITQRDAPDED
jgi:starch synthase (maltosyl-transferring)